MPLHTTAAVTRRSSRPTAGAQPLEPRRLLSYAFADLVHFPLIDNNFANPTSPQGQVVVDSAGDIFGVTNSGGANGVGYLYELTKGASTPTTLASFVQTSVNAPDPQGLVADAAGDLYGIFEGGTYGVFELPKGGTSIETLASFSAANDAFGPGNLLIDSAGNLYGTSEADGTNGTGTIWELPAGGTAITVLANFPAGSRADPDESLVMDASGTLFGTAQGDGAGSDFGFVFELPKGSGTIGTVASFTGGAGGQFPQSGLAIDSAGDLFGTTSGADVGTASAVAGTVFKVAAGTTTITTLATFSADDAATGTLPTGPVALDPAGDLFGVANKGGSSSFPSGVVWELPAGSGTLAGLHSFDDQDGFEPNAGVVVDAAGDVIGVTNLGGSAVGGGGGVLFELTLGSTTPTPTPTPTGPLSAALTGALPTTSLIAGQKASLTQKLTFTDTAAITENVSVELFLSSGTTVDASSVALPPAVPKRINLKAGKSMPISLKVTSIPTGTANGTYHVVAQATNATGTAIDAASAGTVTVAPAQIDLSGAFVKATRTVKNGKSLSVTFTLTNAGDVPAVGSLPIQIDLSTADTDDQDLNLAQIGHPINVKPGKRVTVTVKDDVLAVPNGTYFVFVQLDPDNTFNDVNTANNDFASPAAVVTVTGLPL
jgi:uncharacterized repeat protein (TIGR03803 family)